MISRSIPQQVTLLSSYYQQRALSHCVAERHFCTSNSLKSVGWLFFFVFKNCVMNFSYHYYWTSSLYCLVCVHVLACFAKFTVCSWWLQQVFHSCLSTSTPCHHFVSRKTMILFGYYSNVLFNLACFCSV